MNILDILIVLILLSWIGGFSFSVGGGVIHTLLVIALVLAIVRLAGGRKI